MPRSEENGAETEPLRTTQTEVETKPTCLQRINNIRQNITVEPAAFLMLFPSILSAISTQTLALDKTCRVNLNLSTAICDAVQNQNTDNNTANERLVQAYVADLLTWKSIITSVLPCLLLAFVGGWMDRTGRRKVIMLLPVVGEMLQNISTILNVVFFDQLKVEYLIFLEATFSSIFGGWSVMFLAIFSYIADITTEENRTHRLGLVSFCTYVGMPIGMALSGIILKQFGYYAIYGTSLTLHFLNLLYITLRLTDPLRTKEMKEVSAMFSITILSRRLQIDDSLLCLISVVSKFTSATWTAFANTDLEMYIIPVVDLLNATTFTSLRSIISKLVEKQEIAKMNSMFSLTETVAALLFHPLYSWLYMKTLHVLPGAVFLTSALITIPASIILTSFYIQHRKELRSTRKMALEAQEKKDAEVKKSALDINAVNIKEKPVPEPEKDSIEYKTKL